MAKAEKQYRRLPGRSSAGFGIVVSSRPASELWLGSDHLLRVDRQGYAERYRRFDFADIQSFVIEQTPRHFWGTMFGLVLFFLVLALAALTPPPLNGISGAAAGIVLLVTIVHALRGPTCRCVIRTAVQTESLPSLNRLRAARRVLRLLHPLVEAAQGSVTSEAAQEQWARARTREVGATLAGPNSSIAAGGRADAATGGETEGVERTRGPLSPNDRLLYQILYTSLLLQAALAGLNFVVQHAGLVAIQSLLAACIMVLAVMGLARHGTAPVTAGLRRINWTTTVLQVLHGVVSYGYFMTVPIRRSGTALDQWEFFQWAAETSPYDDAMLMALTLGLIVPSVLLGLLGWGVLAWGQRSERLARTTPAGSSPSVAQVEPEP